PRRRPVGNARRQSPVVDGGDPGSQRTAYTPAGDERDVRLSSGQFDRQLHGVIVDGCEGQQRRSIVPVLLDGVETGRLDKFAHQHAKVRWTLGVLRPPFSQLQASELWMTADEQQ